MKYSQVILQLMLGLVAALPYSPLSAQSEVEPNNMLSEANLIPLATNITGTINPASDNDYYRFEITEPGVLNITVTNVPSNIDMDFNLFNTNQQQIDAQNFNDGQNFSLAYQLCTPGFYYIRLADNEGNDGQYNMLLTFDTSDIYECNYDIPNAQEIFFETPVSASIYPAHDNDYYRFFVSQPGVVNVSVSNIPSNIDMDFNLFNTNQQQIDAQNFNDGQNFLLSYLICESGYYYLRLADNEGNASPYTLLLTLDVSDIYECNNSLVDAVQIPLGVDINASIHPANDNDFFEFEISQAGVVSIHVFNVPANIDMDYQFFNENGISVATAAYNDGENFIARGLLCNPGTYTFRLADNEGNPAQYTVRVDFDTSDAYECNQNPNDAVAVSCNIPILASINPANDVDCYEVTLVEPDIITAIVSNVPSNQSMTVTLHGPEPATQELRRVNGNTGQSVTLVSPTTLQPGTYQVCITDNNTNAAQYQLNINCPSVVSTSEVPWANEVALYPNPTDGWLLLELPNTLSPNTVEYRIIDALGRVWLTQKAQGHEEQVDASLLPAGYYFLQLNTADGRLTRAFLRL